MKQLLEQPMKTDTSQVEWTPGAPLLLTIRQTALLLGVSDRTVRRLLFNRELPARKIGGLTRIPRASVEAFIRKDHPTIPK